MEFWLDRLPVLPDRGLHGLHRLHLQPVHPLIGQVCTAIIDKPARLSICQSQLQILRQQCNHPIDILLINHPFHTLTIPQIFQ